MATAEQYGQWIVANKDKRGTPEFETVAKAYKAARESVAPVETPELAPVEAPAAPGPGADPRGAWDRASKMDIVAGLPATRIAAGLVSPVVGALQAGANTGDWIAEKMGSDPVFGKYIAEKIGEFEASKKRGMEALDPLSRTDKDILGFAGEVGGGGAVVKNVVTAPTRLGKVAQGTAVGTGIGAATPSSEPGQTASQAGMGFALGGAVPAVAPAIKKMASSAYRIIEPALDPMSIKGRAYLEAAGDKATDIVNMLRSNKPAVTGSRPTASQAAVDAGRAEFSALGRSASNVLPSEYVARDAANAAARVNNLNFALTDAERAAAETLRDTTAKTNYAAARATGIDQDMAVALKPQIKLLLERPSIKEARRIGVGLAKEKNLRFDKMGQLEGLEWIKKGLDEQISAASKSGSSAGKEKAAALLQTKDDLLATMKELSPGYEKARAKFAEQSAPINQSDVGRYLKDKLTPALDETANQKSASFAGAVRDAPGTIKRSLTNAPRYQKLSDVLTPDQVSKVEAIRKELAIKSKDEFLAKKGAQAGPNALDVASSSVTDATGGGRIPNPLNRMVTIANAILSRLEGKIDKKLAIEIAQEMLEPKVVAGVLEKEIAKSAAKKSAAAVSNKLSPMKTAAGVNALVTATQD